MSCKVFSSLSKSSIAIMLAASACALATAIPARANALGPSRLEAQGTVSFSGISLDNSVFQQLDNVGDKTATQESFPMNLTNSCAGGQVVSNVTGNFIAQYGYLSIQLNANGGEVPDQPQGRAVIVPDIGSFTGGSPVADYRDNLVITGPANTSVQITITNILTGSVSSDAYSSASLAADFQTGTSPDGANYTFQPFTSLTWNGQTSVTENLTVNVGDRIVLFSNLYGGGGISGNAMPFPPSGLVPSTLSIGNGGVPATDITYISLPAGFGYTSDSGTIYASAVPEPASLLALAAAPALLLKSRRRRSA